MPNEIVDLLQPPANDRLGVLTGTARVVREASLVRLDLDAIERLAARWASERVAGEHRLPGDALFRRDGAHTQLAAAARRAQLLLLGVSQ